MARLTALFRCWLRDIFFGLNRIRNTAQCCHRSGLVSGVNCKPENSGTVADPNIVAAKILLKNDRLLANATATRRAIIPQAVGEVQRQFIRRASWKNSGKSSSEAAIAINPPVLHAQSRESTLRRRTDATVYRNSSHSSAILTLTLYWPFLSARLISLIMLSYILCTAQPHPREKGH